MDASSIVLGAVLQPTKDDELVTIAFASRRLTTQEQKYSVGELEALACLWACEHWGLYLWGRPFILRTDHQALVTLLSTKGVGRCPFRIAKWHASYLHTTLPLNTRRVTRILLLMLFQECLLG